MADKKDSELTIKSAIVAGDLIPLLDSETAVEAEKNKMVAPSTIFGSTSINALSDVDTTINSVGRVLVWTGSSWLPTIISVGPTEETWTPVVSSVSVTNSRGYVQTNGDMITLIFSFTMPTTASGATFFINNAPITSAVAGVGKPAAYHGTITKKFAGNTSIDNRLELGANSAVMAAVSDAAPLGRALSYFSDEDITGFITYVKD